MSGLSEKKPLAGREKPPGILFGTSAKEAYVRYDIYTSDKLIKRSYPILSNEVIPIDIPFLEEYGQQIWLYISYVKDKKFFSGHSHPKGQNRIVS